MGDTSLSPFFPSLPIFCVSLVSSLRGLLCLPSQVVSPVHRRAGACGRIPGDLCPPLPLAVLASVIRAPCVLRVCVEAPPQPRGRLDPALLLCTAHQGLAERGRGKAFPRVCSLPPSPVCYRGQRWSGVAPSWPVAGSWAQVMG